MSNALAGLRAGLNCGVTPLPSPITVPVAGAVGSPNLTLFSEMNDDVAFCSSSAAFPNEEKPAKFGPELELLPLLSPFSGHRAIKCSVLLQIRHFMTSPLRSLGLPERPNPLPVVFL